MPNERKTFIPTEFKLDGDGEGTFTAVFATLNVVDHDGDITLPGAFGEQRVKISQYNHGSWNDGAKALPIGVGRIYESGNDAIVAGEFDMDDADAVKTYNKLKYLHDKGHTQEWSYALPDIDWEIREEDGRRIRVLKRITVPEVSPVMLGAGMNTRLLTIKSGKSFADHIENVLADVLDLIVRAKEIQELRESKGKDLSDETTYRLCGLAAALKSSGENLADLLRRSQGEDEEATKEYLRFLKTTALGGEHA